MKTVTETKAINRFTDADFKADETYPAARTKAQSVPEISFVIPAMNEEDSLQELVARINRHVGTENFEIILIDDGSTDDTWSVMQALADLNPKHVRGLRFRSNRGKAAGLQAGFDVAQGQLISQWMLTCRTIRKRSLASSQKFAKDTIW